MRSRGALGLVLLGAGVLWLLSAADVVHLSYTTWIGVLLIAIGLAIALIPGGHGALVFVGILILLAGLPALVVEGDLFRGGIGDEVEAPQSATDIEKFEHGIGKLTVDLTSPDLDLDGATVEASIGIGDLLVLVPDDADVALDIHVGIGNVDALGESENGVDVDVESSARTTSGAQELALELEAGIGNVRVERG